MPTGTNRLPPVYSLNRLKMADLSGILNIERATSPSPWTLGQFEKELEKDFSRFWVLKFDQKPVGFAGIWLLGEESQLVSLAVTPPQQKRGLGTFLIQKVFEESRRMGARRMTLEVRATNQPARNFYGEVGFQMKGKREKFYEGCEDAVLMEKAL